MLISIFLLVACNSSNPKQSRHDSEVSTQITFFEENADYRASTQEAEWEHGSFDYLTFEEALKERATDIVIAKYVGSRDFGENWRKFEFIVLERILGDATDRIFVYAQRNLHAHVYRDEYEINYIPSDLEFFYGVDYLLPLTNINSPYANVYDDVDEFVFIHNAVIDLDEPSNSIMYNEPLDYHIEMIHIDENIYIVEIVSFVEGIAEQIEDKDHWELIFIRSTEMKEIIKASPYIFIVEISEPFRLSHEQVVTDWGLTDLYYVTIVYSLKGEVNSGRNVIITFVADTVSIGERHIIAVQPIAEGATHWFDFTSRYSLFSMEQLNEIELILANE